MITSRRMKYTNSKTEPKSNIIRTMVSAAITMLLIKPPIFSEINSSKNLSNSPPIPMKETIAPSKLRTPAILLSTIPYTEIQRINPKDELENFPLAAEAYKVHKPTVLRSCMTKGSPRSMKKSPD